MTDVDAAAPVQSETGRADRVPTTATPRRVDVTESAAALLRLLVDVHGPLMFHQSGGCCDGSTPMCYPQGDFFVSEADEHLGDLEIGGGLLVPVWMSKAQFEYWRHTHLTIDAGPGRAGGFSVEGGTGQRFFITSRLLTDAESAALNPPEVA